MIKTLLLFVGLALPATLLASARETAVEAYRQGNALYEKGNYAEALTEYEKALASFRSFELYFNAGNCHMKLSNIPQAILHYERARKIKPTDEDLISNCELANLKLTDKIEALPTLGVTYWWNSLTAEGMLMRWTWLTLVSGLLGFLLLSLFVITRQNGMRRLFVGLGIVMLLVTAAAWTLASYTEGRIRANTEAIIMADRVDVKTSPAPDATSAFVLHAGTKVVIRNRNDGWIEIRLANGNVGWMPADALEII